MESKKEVISIIPSLKLEEVKKRLTEIRVKGINITHIMDFGKYAKIEIHANHDKADEVATTIKNTVNPTIAEDCIVAIFPVEEVQRIQTHQVAAVDKS